MEGVDRFLSTNGANNFIFCQILQTLFIVFAKTTGDAVRCHAEKLILLLNAKHAGNYFNLGEMNITVRAVCTKKK